MQHSIIILRQSEPQLDAIQIQELVLLTAIWSINIH